MKPRSAPRAQVPPAVANSPRWLLGLTLALSALLLAGWFSPEVSDPDFWWHLKTGQYIWQSHTLPVPDPFAYTTAMYGASYAGEEVTRAFNLTHEWLLQVLYFLVYQGAGMPGIVLFRAALLMLLCALVGSVVYRRHGGFYEALAAGFAAAALASRFALDRPYLVTFLGVSITIALVEWTARSGERRIRAVWLWLLPPLFVVWANCHSGYFLGWLVVVAYSAEALRCRFKGQPCPHDSVLWLAGAAAVLISGANPNGFRIFQILLYYRNSYLTGRLTEWVPPPVWPPNVFTLLLAAGLAVALWRWRMVRMTDWILMAAFAAAALMARRNVMLIACIAPIIIGSYVRFPRVWTWRLRFAAPALLAGGLALGAVRGHFFELRAAEWRYPAGAADFLLAHGGSGPIFNTYELGGYLIWRLAPQQRVFIDGRALNEAVFRDYTRILYNFDTTGGKSAEQLLDQYGVQTILMNGFQYTEGLAYLLAPALADPGQTAWKLVYADAAALVFMRNPPAGVAPIDSLRVLDSLEAQCDLHLAREPEYTGCARAIGQVFTRIGDYARARRWLGLYLSGPHGEDPEAQQAYQRLLNMGR